MKICQMCGDEFKENTIRDKYCSMKCSYKIMGIRAKERYYAKNKGFTPHQPAHPCHFGQECSCNKAKNESCSNEKITTSSNMEEFAKELTSLINKHCIENETNTPDFILSDYLMNCLEAYHSIVIKNKNWHKSKITEIKLENITDVLQRAENKAKTMTPNNDYPLMTHDITDEEGCNGLLDCPKHPATITR